MEGWRADRSEIFAEFISYLRWCSYLKRELRISQFVVLIISWLVVSYSHEARVVWGMTTFEFSFIHSKLKFIILRFNCLQHTYIISFGKTKGNLKIEYAFNSIYGTQ